MDIDADTIRFLLDTLFTKAEVPTPKAEPSFEGAEEAKQRIKILEAKIREKEGRIADIQDELRNVAQSESTLRENSLQDKRTAQQEKTARDQQIATLTAEISKATINVEQLEGMLTTQKNERARQKGELEGRIATLNSQKAELEKKIAAAEEAETSAATEAAAKPSAACASPDTVEKLEAQIAQLQQQVEAEKTQFVSLQSQSNEAKNSVARLTADLDTANKSTAAKVTELATVRQELAEAQKAQQNLEQQLEQANDKLSKAQVAQQQLEKELAAAKAASTGQTGDLNKRLLDENKRLGDEISKLSTNLRDANLEKDRIEGTIRERELEIQKANSQINSKNAELEAYQARINSLEEEVNALKNSAANPENVAKLQVELDECKAAKTKLTENISKLTEDQLERNAKYDAEYITVNNQRTEALEAKNTLAAQLQKVRKEADDLRIQLVKAQKELAELKAIPASTTASKRAGRGGAILHNQLPNFNKLFANLQQVKNESQQLGGSAENLFKNYYKFSLLNYKLNKMLNQQVGGGYDLVFNLNDDYFYDINRHARFLMDKTIKTMYALQDKVYITTIRDFLVSNINYIKTNYYFIY